LFSSLVSELSMYYWYNKFFPVHVVTVFILSITLFSLRVAAQSVGKISGDIKDVATGEPMIGCNVSIVGTKLGSMVDIDGSYFILNIPPGKYEVLASMIGYQKVLQREVIVNAEKTTTVNFFLSSTTVEQNVVEIIATRPDVEKEKTSTSTIIRTDDVQSIAGMRNVQDVIGLAADVTDGHFRGGRSGEELYTLQGMGIVNPLDATSAFIPIMSAVEEVEVITSGFGAQYGNAQSGVVNITMKEGKSDLWRSRFELRVRAPKLNLFGVELTNGRKHWGNSVYDPEGNPYLAKLLDPSMWLHGDEDNSGQPLYGSMGSGLTNGYGGDTTVMLQVAQTLWRKQAKRDMYRNYWNMMDYSVEGGTGGPINDDMRMFVAIRSNVTNPVFPTEQPDVERQVMGNVVNDFGSGAKLQISGGYAQNNTNVFGGTNGTGFYNWLWDRILDIEYQKTVNSQLGVRFTQQFGTSTFYELKINALQTKLNLGSAPWASELSADLIAHPQNTNTVITAPITGPDLFQFFSGNDDFRDEKTLTVSFDASITSQVTKSHLVNGGVQLNAYTIQSNDNMSTGSTLQTRKYAAHPFELGVFAQDKMEFEGMIANIGLRLDVWNANKDYYVNIFDPFLNKYEYHDSTGAPLYYFSRNLDSAQTAKTPLLGRLQPRAGISFPVTENTVFHLNYGSYMQRPSFQYILATSIQPQNNTPVTLGNPRLEPQTTNSYDIGVMQGLGEGFTLDISGYYKDVKNLIEQAQFSDIGSSVSYVTFVNRDYADIRGFRISLAKRKENITGSISYQYSVATGKGGGVSNAPPVFRRDTLGEVTTDLTGVPTRDILLDFDRTHNVIINLAYMSNPESGPEVFGLYPLGNWSISINSTVKSGRPYTSSKNVKLINGSRTPAEYNTNMKISKKISKFYGMDMTLYAEVFNLFNDKILNYNYLFATANAGQTNPMIQPYEAYAFNDIKRGVQYWNATNIIKGTSFPVDQSFLVYDNAPRSFNFGVVVDF
jgi:outer membrane receptor protein involved in Fe transport